MNTLIINIGNTYITSRKILILFILLILPGCVKMSSWDARNETLRDSIAVEVILVEYDYLRSLDDSMKPDLKSFSIDIGSIDVLLGNYLGSIGDMPADRYMLKLERTNDIRRIRGKLFDFPNAIRTIKIDVELKSNVIECSFLGSGLIRINGKKIFIDSHSRNKMNWHFEKVE